MATPYHYTESGLDNIWLASGFEYVDRPSGRHVKIRDVEGLHRAIGEILVSKKKNLTGKEFRFLRKEMLMTQAFLAKLLQVTEQTINRWETGKTEIPGTAQSTVRLLYSEQMAGDSEHGVKLREALQELADLEDAIDGQKLTGKVSNQGKWQLELDLAA